MLPACQLFKLTSKGKPDNWQIAKIIKYLAYTFHAQTSLIIVIFPFHVDTTVAFLNGAGDLDIFDASTFERRTLVSRDVFVSSYPYWNANIIATGHFWGRPSSVYKSLTFFSIIPSKAHQCLKVSFIFQAVFHRVIIVFHEKSESHCKVLGISMNLSEMGS